MSDLELLYALLVVFYLWECACWIRRGGVAFVRWWGQHAISPPLIGNQRGGFALAQPLPPLGSVAVATQLPVSLSPIGALAYVAATVNPAGRAPQTGRFVRWEDVKSIQAHGKSVRVNQTLFVLAQSTSHARWLGSKLRTLAKLQPGDREDAINQFIRSAFDVGSVKARWADLQTRTRHVRWLANALLLFIFIVAPAAVWRLGITQTWLPLLLGLFALSGTIAFIFRRAHRALHPQADDERFTQSLMILLFPPTATRACDLLSRPLLESFHPLAVAAVLCRESELRSLAKRLLLDLQHPALPLATEGNSELAGLETFFRRTTLAAAEAALRDSGLDPAELTAPPQRADATSVAYCPRCHAQFTKSDVRCGDCGGIRVEPLAKDAAS